MVAFATMVSVVLINDTIVSLNEGNRDSVSRHVEYGVEEGLLIIVVLFYVFCKIECCISIL